MITLTSQIKISLIDASYCRAQSMGVQAVRVKIAERVYLLALAVLKVITSGFGYLNKSRFIEAKEAWAQVTQGNRFKLQPKDQSGSLSPPLLPRRLSNDDVSPQPSAGTSSDDDVSPQPSAGILRDLTISPTSLNETVDSMDGVSTPENVRANKIGAFFNKGGRALVTNHARRALVTNHARRAVGINVQVVPLKKPLSSMALKQADQTSAEFWEQYTA